MRNKGELAPPSPTRAWTRPEDYLSALARRRTARKARGGQEPRTQPEAPKFLLSTLPFLVLLVALAVIAIGLFAAAWPAGQPQPQPRAEAAREPGTAPKGWFQEAEKEFNRS